MLPSLGALSLHGPPVPTGPHGGGGGKQRFVTQEWPVPWRMIKELESLVKEAILHKMDFHPRDHNARILNAFLHLLPGHWENKEAEAQLERTKAFLRTYARPFGIKPDFDFTLDAPLMEQIHSFVRFKLIPELKEFLKRHPHKRPEYYVPPWLRHDFYKKLHELHPGRAHDLNRDLNRYMKPLLKGDWNAWSGRSATPVQDVLIFFEAWLKDEDPNNPWQVFAHPHLAHESGWTPEQMVSGDFSFWMGEIQRRLYKRARDRAGGAGPSGQ